jgi:hypothetical protein
MKPLLKAKFVKLQAMLGLQEIAIIRGYIEVILGLESLEHCVNEGVLEQQAMQGHHTLESDGDSQLKLD